MTEQELFLDARDRPLADRPAFLAAACGADRALRARVERLLAADAAHGTVLDRPPAPGLDPHALLSTLLPHDTPTPVGGTPLGLPASDHPNVFGRVGQYELLAEIGRGGFGVVYRALDTVLRREVAVKVLYPFLAADPASRARLLREARAAAAVRHPNVVQVYDVGESPTPFLVMEYVPGETLQQRLHRRTHLPAAEAVDVARQVAEGLAAAHAAGLVHRDVKPANVLLDADGRAMVSDFGLAWAADDAGQSAIGAAAGTPLYMSPEQARGERPDHRGDLFSLGSVLYAMLAGRPPFTGGSVPAVVRAVSDATPPRLAATAPDTPAWLCSLVGRLLTKDPAARPESARQVADALAHGDPLTPPLRGRRGALLAAVAALTVVVPAVWPARTEPEPLAEAITLPAADPDPDRRAAEGLRRAGANTVVVATSDDKWHNIEPYEPLPTAPFRLKQVRLRGPSMAELGDGLPEFLASHLHGVRLNGIFFPPRTTPSALARSAALPELTELTIVSISDSPELNDNLFASLATLLHLTNLDLGNGLPGVSGCGVEALRACPKFEILTLLNDQFAAEAAEELRHLPQLRYLNLSGTPFTPRHAAAVAATPVRKLVLARCGLDDMQAAMLASMPGLEELNIAGNPLTDRGLAEFHRCRGLKAIDVGVTEVTPAGIAAFRAAMPECEVMWK